jgi:hypothetical protein
MIGCCTPTFTNSLKNFFLGMHSKAPVQSMDGQKECLVKNLFMAWRIWEFTPQASCSALWMNSTNPNRYSCHALSYLGSAAHERFKNDFGKHHINRPLAVHGFLLRIIDAETNQANRREYEERCRVFQLQQISAQQMHDAEAARQQQFAAQQHYDAEVARQFLAQQYHQQQIAQQNHEAEVARQQAEVARQKLKQQIAQQNHAAEVARQQAEVVRQQAEVARQQAEVLRQQILNNARVSAAAAPEPVNRFQREAPARTYERPLQAPKKPEATKKKFNPREFLCKHFQRYSIPLELGLSITIVVAALLSSALFSSYLAVLVVCISLYLLQEEHEGLSFGRCFCLSLFPFVLRAVIEFVSDSETTGLAVFCVMMYPFQPHPAAKTL